jgi:hypothetical protein
MEMDKRTILALILSIGIIFAWNVIFPPQEINQKQKEKEFAELRAKEEQRINQLVAEKKEELREISMAFLKFFAAVDQKLDAKVDLLKKSLYNL